MKTLTTKPESKTSNRSPFFKRSGESGFFGVQTKLIVNKPKDKYEVEADHVADKVIKRNQTNSGSFFASAQTNIQRQTEEEIQEKPLAESITPLVQRKEEENEEEQVQPKLNESVQLQEEDEVQMQADEDEQKVQKQEEEEEEVQTKAEKIQKQNEEEEAVQAKSEEEEEVQTYRSSETEAISKSPAIEKSLKETRGTGSSLQDSTKSKLEQNLGVDLSGVKIHTGSKAVEMNKQLKSQAFTNKNNIYFNEGKFNPEISSGQHLLVHELTHTIQQGAVPVKSTVENSEKQTGTEKSSAPDSENVTDVRENQSQNSNQAEEAKKEFARNDLDSKPEQVKGSNKSSEKGFVSDTLQKPASSEPASEKSAVSEYPKNPEEDPNFQASKQKIKAEAKRQKTHQPAGTEAQAAQNAAPPPANERESQAQAAQVETMDQQEPGEFNAAAFKEKLMQRIRNMQLPANQEQAADFENNNNIEDVSQAAQADVSSEQAQAAGPVEQAASAEPDIGSIPAREVENLPEPQIGEHPRQIGAQNAMPQARPESQVNQPLQDNMQDVNQAMADNEITDTQLANANEPKFSEALNAKQEAENHTQNAPDDFRIQEQQALSASGMQAQAVSESQLTAMHGQRGLLLNQVAAQQGQTATQDSAERERIASEINTIYDKTKTDVEAVLEKLDESVSTMFSSAAEKAKTKFEAHVKQRMDAYKSRRYSGLRGAARWVRDKFMGIPEEVNQFFTEGRQKYIDEMDVALTAISQHVAEKLTEAKNRIAKGKQEVNDYVTALPEALQGIGREAAENIQGRFDELENSVESKQDELIDSLAQQYTESLQEVDARIEEMKAANRGLVDRALDAVKGVIETIIQIKNTLTNMLASAISVIRTIIADPIGFLGNLISGISQGFKNFGTNILTHLTSGLVGWLTGALGSVGITIPKDLFSLKGIFSLVMQVLGLTWDYIRQKAVKLLGEPVVRILETGFEVFQIIRSEGIAGLWNYIKEQFNDLKETVIDTIKEMVITQVIQAGIKWVLGLMNPVGAFIKAAMAIIDIVKFFIERGRQILELVNAFIEGVKAVASGSVARVAQAIENALARAIPVVIGFLASLLGLGGLASKVQNLIKRIRSRIDKAIDKVILKAKSWFRKAGTKIKGAATKFFKWWKARKNFKGDDGKIHKLYFAGEGNSAKLMVASNPTAFSDFIISVDVGNDAKKKAAKQQAVLVAAQIDAKKREQISGASEAEKSNNIKKKQEEIEALLSQLASYAKVLFGTAVEDLPETDVTFSSSTIGGDEMGTLMTARLLAKKGPGGSVPSSRKHVVFDSLLKRRLGGSSYYVRGHLLNHNTHGKGDWKNMTPLSKEGNRVHENTAESKVKSAVSSGAIVFYQVKPVYGRGELNTPANADPVLKEIRNAEKYVPDKLEVEASLLKPKTENFAKKQTLVSKQTIPNPIDTSLGSYQLSSSAKQKVVLTKDTATKIFENTGNSFTPERIQEIQNAAKSISELNRYDQIKEKFNQNPEIQSDIEKLRGMTNVVLK